MYEICDDCITDKSECVKCKHAPQYRDYPNQSKFKAYNPTCPLGYDDCIGDPAYIKYHYPEWYEKLYGNKTPEEAAEEDCSKRDTCCYDNEDK